MLSDRIRAIKIPLLVPVSLTKLDYSCPISGLIHALFRIRMRRLVLCVWLIQLWYSVQWDLTVISTRIPRQSYGRYGSLLRGPLLLCLHYFHLLSQSFRRFWDRRRLIAIPSDLSALLLFNITKDDLTSDFNISTRPSIFLCITGFRLSLWKSSLIYSIFELCLLSPLWACLFSILCILSRSKSFVL